MEFDFCQTPEEEDKLAYEAACVAGRVKELLRSGAAVEGEPLQSAMSPEDYAIVSGRESYELRFWLVDLWGELMNRLR